MHISRSAPAQIYNLDQDLEVSHFRGVSRGGLRGLQPPAAPKYLLFSDRELQFEKNLRVLAPILTDIRFSKYITLLFEIMH